MSIEHWMMFSTFAEQRHFIHPSKDTYTGVVLNGNMVAHAPDGLGAFLLEKTEKQCYIIDPITHAFQHDPYFINDDEGSPKSSIKALADAYGKPVKDIVGSRPLLPSDLNDDGVLREFVDCCLTFQDKTLAEVMAGNDSIKYFVGLTEDKLRPVALVSPYFYLTETTYNDWIDVMCRAGTCAKKLKTDARIYTSVVVSQGVILDETISREIASRLINVGFDGFLLWVDNLDELSAGGAELSGLLRLARLLRNGDRLPVINLHGGYFSIMAAGTLGRQAFSGVTHAPEFGEYRSVVPVGGGIPIARYYIPQIHARVRYRDALRFLNSKGWLSDAATFHREVCNCPACQDVIGGNAANFTLYGEDTIKEVRRGRGLVRIGYPTSATKLRCLRHYLYRKAAEYSFAADSAEPIIEDLQHGVDELKSVMGLDGVSHLILWQKVLGR